MKRKISISLFFTGLTICLCIGIILGIQMQKNKKISEDKPEIKDFSLIKGPENVIIQDEIYPVSVNDDTITADTTYMILEKDMNTGNITKNLSRIPEKYIGLTREQLLDHLADLEANPPLTELERGFVSLDLVAFSPIQVEIQMNYQPLGIVWATVGNILINQS